MPKPARAPVTLKHIAQHTGLSIMTVSRVVRGRPDVSPASRRKVLTAVRRLGYIPNPAAQLPCGSIRAAAILASRSHPPVPCARGREPRGRKLSRLEFITESNRNQGVHDTIVRNRY
jgi:transcriptional regulator with XRE-family HTH domain